MNFNILNTIQKGRENLTLRARTALFGVLVVTGLFLNGCINSSKVQASESASGMNSPCFLIPEREGDQMLANEVNYVCELLQQANPSCYDNSKPILKDSPITQIQTEANPDTFAFYNPNNNTITIPDYDADKISPEMYREGLAHEARHAQQHTCKSDIPSQEIGNDIPPLELTIGQVIPEMNLMNKNIFCVYTATGVDRVIPNDTNGNPIQNNQILCFTGLKELDAVTYSSLLLGIESDSYQTGSLVTNLNVMGIPIDYKRLAEHVRNGYESNISFIQIASSIAEEYSVDRDRVLSIILEHLTIKIPSNSLLGMVEWDDDGKVYLNYSYYLSESKTASTVCFEDERDPSIVKEKVCIKVEENDVGPFLYSDKNGHTDVVTCLAGLNLTNVNISYIPPEEGESTVSYSDYCNYEGDNKGGIPNTNDTIELRLEQTGK